MPTVTPHLIVTGAARAIEFYVKAFGAKERKRFIDKKHNYVVYSELEIGGGFIIVSDEVIDWGSLSPNTLGNTPLMLVLDVEDADAVAAAMLAHGATLVADVEDKFYGLRQGRFNDPFGHLWVISQKKETLDAEEVQRRVDAFHAELPDL